MTKLRSLQYITVDDVCVMYKYGKKHIFVCSLHTFTNRKYSDNLHVDEVSIAFYITKYKNVASHANKCTGITNTTFLHTNIL